MKVKFIGEQAQRVMKIDFRPNDEKEVPNDFPVDKNLFEIVGEEKKVSESKKSSKKSKEE